MLTKPKTTGVAKVIRFKRRQQKRNPRRPLEAVAKDFERWDAAAAALGLNWSEFARRAMNRVAELELAETPQMLSAERGAVYGTVSEKGASKKRTTARTKPTAKRAVRKG